jgi:hypothetical protein
MSKTNEFWQYAKEAILSACCAESAEERQRLLDLARTWTQAALMERHAQLNDDSAVECAPRSGQDHAAVLSGCRAW